MKIIVFLLALLYFISCQELIPCGVTNMPKKKSECFKRKSTIENLECCYIEISVKNENKDTSYNLCCPGSKAITDEAFKNYVKMYGQLYIGNKEFDLTYHECKSSYLKVGFFLLSLLFLI